jgi:putative tryptophan/tyrosine transport system substrate-binding protein
MKRRELLLGSAAAIWTLQVEAQQQLPTAAIIGHTALEYGQWAAALVERLSQLGWIEGRTLQIEYRWTQGRPERVAEIASELVHQKVSVIVTYGGAAVILKQAMPSTPIVFAPAVDPIEAGLVANLSRPGGNVTGMSVQQAEIASKRLELLREIVPALAKVAILFDITYPASAREADNVQTSARQLGLAVTPLGVRNADGIMPALDSVKGRVGAVYLGENALITSNSARIIAFALDAKLPMAVASSEIVKAGALVSYGPDYPDLFRRAARIVDKILRGAEPSDIPVEEPTKFDLVINLKTGKALDLTIPPNLLALADEVIE